MVTLPDVSIFEELALAVPHNSRDGSVVSSRDERQPAQNYGRAPGVRSMDIRVQLQAFIFTLAQQLEDRADPGCSHDPLHV